MKNFISIFVSLGYIGFIRPASGTVATIISIIILFPLFNFSFFSYYVLIGIFFFILILSIFLINSFSKETNTQDSNTIVIDEFLGVFFIFLFYDKIFILNDLITLMLIFILFRFFDIIKFFPANWIDKKIKNSLGVILDDIIAAIYSLFTIYLINEIFL